MTWVIVYIPYWESASLESVQTLCMQCVADKYVLIFDGGTLPDVRLPGIEYRHNREHQGVIHSLRKWIPKKASYYCVLRKGVHLNSSKWESVQQKMLSVSALYCGWGEDGFLMMNRQAYQAFIQIDTPV